MLGKTSRQSLVGNRRGRTVGKRFLHLKSAVPWYGTCQRHSSSTRHDQVLAETDFVSMQRMQRSQARMGACSRHDIYHARTLYTPIAPTAAGKCQVHKRCMPRPLAQTPAFACGTCLRHMHHTIAVLPEFGTAPCHMHCMQPVPLTMRAHLAHCETCPPRT